MEPDPSIGELLVTFLFVGIIAIVRMSLIVFPIVGVGIWIASRVRRRRNGAEVISIGESAVADEGAGDAGEDREADGLPLAATVETSAAGEPGHGAFDGPPVAPPPL